MDLQEAKQYLGKVVKIIDNEYEGEGVFIGYAPFGSNYGASFEPPKGEPLQFPFRIFIQNYSKPVSVRDFEPIERYKCPECEHEYSDKIHKCTCQTIT